MPKSKTFPAVLLSICAATAGADTSSRSVAECAGLLQAVSELNGGPIGLLPMTPNHQDWIDAGRARALAEGQFYPAFFVASMETTARMVWLERGVEGLRSEEFRTTVSRCQVLSQSLSSDPQPAN